MGDLIQFPVGGRRGRPSGPVEPREPARGVSVMYCAACGEKRSQDAAAADPGPCKCGGLIFTNDSGLGVGAAMHVQAWSPVPGVEVVSPGPTFLPPHGGATA